MYFKFQSSMSIGSGWKMSNKIRLTHTKHTKVFKKKHVKNTNVVFSYSICFASGCLCKIMKFNYLQGLFFKKLKNLPCVETRY